MTEDIKELKRKVMEFMEQELTKYPNGRMDVKQAGELADIVKDLAMAEYYCTVAESMTDSMGYTQPMSRSGGMGSSRRGYGSSGTMGHTDSTEIIRNMLASLSPEMRDQLVKEFM